MAYPIGDRDGDAFARTLIGGSSLENEEHILWQFRLRFDSSSSRVRVIDKYWAHRLWPQVALVDVRCPVLSPRPSS